MSLKGYVSNKTENFFYKNRPLMKKLQIFISVGNKDEFRRI